MGRTKGSSNVTAAEAKRIADHPSGRVFDSGRPNLLQLVDRVGWQVQLACPAVEGGHKGNPVAFNLLGQHRDAHHHDLLRDNDPSRKLIRQVLNAVAEYERSALVAKLAAARARKKRTGGHSVGAYRFGKHPDRPDEAETLARIRELRRASPSRRRRSLATVAEILIAEGRRSRSERPWTAAMVRDLVS